MSDERLAKLGRIWGLVGLGALAYCGVRFLLVVLGELVSTRLSTDWRVLTARMSQLKPIGFKAKPWAIYANSLFVLCVVLVLGMLAVALYDLLRREPPATRDEPRPDDAQG